MGRGLGFYSRKRWKEWTGDWEIYLEITLLVASSWIGTFSNDPGLITWNRKAEC